MDFFDLLEQECQSVITRISCLIVYYGIILSPKFQVIYDNYRKLFKFRNLNDYLTIFSKLSMIEESLLEDLGKTYEPYIQNIELPYGRFYISSWSWTNPKMELTFENIFRTGPFIILIMVLLFTAIPTPLGLVLIIALTNLLCPTDRDAPP